MSIPTTEISQTTAYPSGGGGVMTQQYQVPTSQQYQVPPTQNIEALLWSNVNKSGMLWKIKYKTSLKHDYV
jgi:hypothetical protein